MKKFIRLPQSETYYTSKLISIFFYILFLRNKHEFVSCSSLFFLILRKELDHYIYYMHRKIVLYLFHFIQLGFSIFFFFIYSIKSHSKTMDIAIMATLIALPFFLLFSISELIRVNCPSLWAQLKIKLIEQDPKNHKNNEASNEFEHPPCVKLPGTLQYCYVLL